MFESWNVSKVFDALPSPSSLKDAQKRCAFLLAMASSRRPSELASLKCSPEFMIISDDKVRFLPSKLSKTDRQSHLGPPIVIMRLPPTSDNSPCPVEALSELLRFRSKLHLSHDFIFTSCAPPFKPLSTAAFSDLLRACFQRAGISAPPGSTRAISVSDAFARGASIDEVLHAGDWSSASTFFAHYLRRSASASASLRQTSGYQGDTCRRMD